MNDIPAAPDAAPPSARAIALLRRGPFARYALGEIISMTGTWMQAMAQGWVMTGLTNKAIMLGWVQFASSMPMLLLTMYGGSVADRHDKRKVLILTLVAQSVLALGIGWLVAVGQVQIWHVMVAAVLLGVSASFEMPAAGAMVAELVRKEEIASAIAIDRAIFHGTRLLGPAAAGYIAGEMGEASAFFVNALSFMALILALLTIQPRGRGSAEEEKERSSGMKAGIDYVRGDKPTLAMLTLMSATSLFTFPFMVVMLPWYARQELHLDVAQTGTLMSVTGVGSLVAAIGLLSVPRPRRMLWMIAGTIDIALSLTALAMARSFPMAAGAFAALAVGVSLNYGLANTTVQERAPGPLRGRVSALAAMSFVGIMPLSSLGMTALADQIGMRTAMFVGAFGYAAAGLFAFTGPGRQCSKLPTERTVAVPVGGRHK
jgi:MFS family permease